MISCQFEDGVRVKLRHACVDALVLRKDKILMVKRAKPLLESGKWGIVGGFVDPGETLAQAVRREILEETGYNIKDLQLLTVVDTPHRQNDDRQNISFVYICQATEKVGEPDNESTEQKWFSLDCLPSKQQIAFDFAADIDLYKRCLK